MRRKKRNEVLVGAFLCVGLVLFVLLLFLMGTLDTVLRKTVTVDADFGDVQSLQEGDPVYLFGMKVGKVRRIALLPPEEGKPAVIRVALVIPAEHRGRLRRDSLVKIDKSLTGNLSVLIQESGGEVLPPGVPLQGSEAADLASVTEKVQKVLGEGEKLIAAAGRMLREIEEKGEIQSAISDIAGIARDARSEIGPLKDRLLETLEVLRGLLEDNRLDLRHTIANLKEMTARTKAITEGLEGTPEQVNRSLAEIEKAGGSLATMLRENRSSIGAMVDDLSQASANLANLTADVKRRPWRIFYRPGAAELKEMDLYDAAWAYNLGAAELNRTVRDLSARMEGAAGTGPDAKDIEKIKVEIAERLKRQREFEEAFWEKLNADG
jgi:phospholipid/cholesterol/gamma-HCH transport system substrate-binding protein